MNQRELKQSIEEDPNLTDSEKARKLNALCEPYTKMSDEELLQLVRDFTMEYLETGDGFRVIFAFHRLISRF